MITELDAWYTAIITVAKYNVKFTCSKDVTIAFWLAFGLVMVGFAAYLALTCITFFKKRNYCIYVAIICVSIFCVWIISSFYILGDNKQPLDCYNSQNNINRVHLSFVCVSLTFYIVILIVNLVALKRWKNQYESLHDQNGNNQDQNQDEHDVSNQPIQNVVGESAHAMNPLNDDKNRNEAQTEEEKRLLEDDNNSDED